MSTADWTFCTGVLGVGDVARGVTAGPTKPTGGGTFVYAMNSLTNTPGSVALYATPQAPNTNFNPLVKGGSISAAMQRPNGGGVVDWSSYLFIGLGGTSVNDNAYMLGFSNADPSRLILRKGSLALGIPDEPANPAGANGILRRSTQDYGRDTWFHFMLEMVYNTNGDVVLNCYEAPIGNVTTPVWSPIVGMAAFVDDAVGIATGSLPYTSGRVGFGARFADVSRRAYWDHPRVVKQP